MIKFISLNGMCIRISSYVWTEYVKPLQNIIVLKVNLRVPRILKRPSVEKSQSCSCQNEFVATEHLASSSSNHYQVSFHYLTIQKYFPKLSQGHPCRFIHCHKLFATSDIYASLSQSDERDNFYHSIGFFVQLFPPSRVIFVDV